MDRRDAANLTRMDDFRDECTFAWNARIPIASANYRLLDNDIEALRRRLSRLALGSQVIEGEKFIDCAGPPSRIPCATTWKIFQAIEVFAGRHAVTSSEYRMTCGGRVAEHVLGFVRPGSPAARGDTLPQLRELFRDNIARGSIPEVCWTRCLHREDGATESERPSTAAKPIVHLSQTSRLNGSNGGQKIGSGAIAGTQASRTASQGTLLFLLVLSYLFYYHMGIQLEIVAMPHVEVMQEAAWRNAMPATTSNRSSSNRI